METGTQQGLVECAMGDLTWKRAALQEFRRAAARESHVLMRYPEHLWQQLFNRLQWADGEELQCVLATELKRRMTNIALRDARSKPSETEGSGAESVRNNPCPCGSGKKYRFCHGAVVDQAGCEIPDELATPSPRDVVAATREHVGRLEDAGDIRGALALAEHAAEFARMRGLDPETQGVCLMDVGLLQQQLGDHCQAEDSFDRAAQAFRAAPGAAPHLLEGALRRRLRSLRLLRDPRARFVEEEIAALEDAPAAPSYPHCGKTLPEDLPWRPTRGRDAEA